MDGEKLLNHIQSAQLDFKKNFSHLARKKLAIYGIGRATGNITPAFKDFQIVGLLDKNLDNIGKFIFGIKVISVQEAVSFADCIIINTSETYWRIIYERIKNCGIPVYLKNGKLAKDYFRPFSLEYLLELCNNERKKQIICLLQQYLGGIGNWNGVFSSWKDWGFCVWGMVVWSYLCWMECERRKDGRNQLLFLSRDGYLLKKAYDSFFTCIDFPDVVDSKYVVTSRRLTYAANVCDEQGFQGYSTDFFTGTFADYMLTRYGVSIEEKDPNACEILRLPVDAKRLEKLLCDYKSMLLMELERERKLYTGYLSNLSISRSCGVVDTGFTGRIVGCLQNILGIDDVKAYFFYGDMRVANPYRNNIRVCFQEIDDVDAGYCALRQYSFLVETVFRAPVGTAVNIMEKGFVYDKSPDFILNKGIYEGIFQFMKEAAKRKWDPVEWKEISLFVDELFSYMMSHTCLQDDLQERLHWDDAWSGQQYI